MAETAPQRRKTTPEKNPPRRKTLAGRIAITERWHGPDDPRLPELRRELEQARDDQRIAEIVAAWPRFTDKQRAELRILLNPARPVPREDGGARA